MLYVEDLTYRVGGRVLFDEASMHLPKGYKGAIVGRNGIGKSTLFKLILKHIDPDNGRVATKKGIRLKMLEQNVPDSQLCALDYVIEADEERTELLSEEKIATDPYRIADIHARLYEIEAYTAVPRAIKILLGLGFSEDAQLETVASFSGGWRARIALAAALFAQPDILLLDEPTNHLDLEAVAWLENFLKYYKNTVLMISHDRHFLNNVANRIYHVFNKKIKLYPGNYTAFETVRQQELASLGSMQAKQEAQKAHVQQFIDRFRYKSSKAKQVQSRIKMLERFNPIVLPEEEGAMHLVFPKSEVLPSPILSLEKISVGYGDKVVLKNLHFTLRQDDRIALLGPNGNGKSTFAKLLSGQLAPIVGLRRASNKLKIGFFAQHQEEELKLEATPFEHMSEAMPGMPEEKIRAKLGRFMFSRDKCFMKVRELSGGEKARLSLALITVEAPQLLILDEPTNHLDMETRQALIMALNDYQGAVVLISHDWHLLELVADKLWLVDKQTVSDYPGSLEDYRKQVLAS